MPEHRKQPANPHAQAARDFVDDAAVKIVARGFEAIDQLAEIGKRELKKAIIRQFSNRGKK